MTSFKKVLDNAYGQLNAGIGTGDTSIVLKSGEGARFPSSAHNDAILTLVQWDTSGTVPVVSKKERVTQTNRSSDTLTVTRSYGGDSAQTFDADDYIYLNVTAGVIEEIQTAVSTLESTAIIADGSNSMDNNTAIKLDNNAGTPVECFKVDASDILQILTLPRLPSGRSISHDNDVVDKKYGTDNWAGNSVSAKTEASAGSGEIFENTDDDDRLSWKDTSNNVRDIVTNIYVGTFTKTLNATGNFDEAITTKGTPRIIELWIQGLLVDGDATGGAYGIHSYIIFEGSTFKFESRLLNDNDDTCTYDSNNLGKQLVTSPATFGTGGGVDHAFDLTISSIGTTGCTIRLANTKTGAPANSPITIGYKITC